MKDGNRDTRITVAAAQCRSVRGDIEANLATHLRFLGAAVSEGANLVVFPELSLTGYELDLASACVFSKDDPRLAPLVAFARESGTCVVAGAPIESGERRPYLGAFAIAGDAVRTYAKMHVHETESPYFLSGGQQAVLPVAGVSVALAICADTSHASHASDAAANGAAFYAASVMKTTDEFRRHEQRLVEYAVRHRMAVLTANYAGTSGGAESAGNSAVWNERGEVVAQAGGNEGAVVIGSVAAGEWTGAVVAVPAV